MLSVCCSVCSCLCTFLWCRSSILSCSCCIVYCVFHYGSGFLLHLILLLLLLMCRLTVCVIVYPVHFWFHGWWGIRVFYASGVLMTWHVHVGWCMMRRALCIIAQCDMLRSPSVWAVSMCRALRLLRKLCVVGGEAPPLCTVAWGTSDRDDRCLHIHSMWLALLHKTVVPCAHPPLVVRECVESHFL